MLFVVFPVKDGDGDDRRNETGRWRGHQNSSGRRPQSMGDGLQVYAQSTGTKTDDDDVSGALPGGTYWQIQRHVLNSVTDELLFCTRDAALEMRMGLLL